MPSLLLTEFRHQVAENRKRAAYIRRLDRGGWFAIVPHRAYWLNHRAPPRRLVALSGTPDAEHILGQEATVAENFHTPRINFEILTSKPFAKTSRSGRQTLFLPRSMSEMCPRSIPSL